jgi:nickel-dependent lactate racemase
MEADAPGDIVWAASPVAQPLADPGGEGSRDPDRSLDRLLVEPTSGVGLDVRLRDVSRLAIVIPDRTRPAGLDYLLPRLFGFLGQVGGSDRFRVTLLAGGGTHAPDAVSRLRAFVPEAWSRTVACVAHDATRDEAIQLVAETAAGTPVAVNKTLLDQDLALAVGAIGFHYFAGFSGGRKAIFPGLASYESIRLNHRRVLHDEPGQGLHPACRPGNLVGNPVHKDMLDAVSSLPVPTFVVNAFLSTDHRIDGIVTGDLAHAHAEGCRRYAAQHRIRLPARADLVIADAGGHPKDIDLVQAHKALVHLGPAVRDDGVVILCAKCTEGVGSKTMMRWFDYPDSASIEAALRESYMLNSHTALSFRRHTERIRLLLVSDLAPELLSGTGAEPCASLDAAIARARELLSGEINAICLTSPTSDILQIDD